MAFNMAWFKAQEKKKKAEEAAKNGDVDYVISNQDQKVRTSR